MRVCQGLRTTAQQQAAYAEGRTAPGRVVTNADGVHHKSIIRHRQMVMGMLSTAAF